MRKVLKLVLLLQATLLLAPPDVQLVVQCSSSYIDDYFLPTAKIALNKIQQQFTPIGTSASAPLGIISETANLSESGGSVSIQDVEPNRSEFVNLELGRPEQVIDPVVSTQTVDVAGTMGEDATSTIISSTESVSEDPMTSGSSLNSDQSLNVTQQDANVEELAKVEEQTTTSTKSQVNADQEEPTIISNQIDNKPTVGEAESNVRATELDAIAAVEATIGFGDSTLFGSSGPSDACYDEYANARYCEPEFENIAFERLVEASSECGQPASRFCTTYLNERGEQIRNCHICDQQHPKKRHPAAYLTDMNNSNQPTCWVSAPISAQQANDSTGSIVRDNVTLTLNFDKRYELTYVSMQFCSLKPDSLVIMKSNDFGASWTPYQFYSSQCERVYNKPSSTTSASTLASNQTQSDQIAPFEASCVNSSASGQTNGRIAFSTLDGGTRSNKSLQSAASDRSAQLSDWTTATNLRIVLDQHQASWIQSSLAHSHSHSHHQTRANSSIVGASLDQKQELENSLTNPSDTYNYAISDLTVGGRCKCNGHASRCVHNQEGKLQCECQHNTDGPDCERCLPLHHDRPWQRATQLNANPCQPCNCNGHSRKCRFDSELYLLSGRRSGGVCIDCKDNTTGRHCHYCKEGWTRDHTRPMSDRAACKPCNCHPLGSVGKVCNQTSGQCPCKEGVTGLECERCAPGYQQSKSPSEPCIKLPENDINYEPAIVEVNEEPLGPDQRQQTDAMEEDPMSLIRQTSNDIVSGQQAGVQTSNQKTQAADELALSVQQLSVPPASQPPQVRVRQQHRLNQQQQWRQQYGRPANFYSTRQKTRPRHYEVAPPLDDFSGSGAVDEDVAASYEAAANDEDQYQRALSRHQQANNYALPTNYKRTFVDSYVRGRMNRPFVNPAPVANLDHIDQGDDYAPTQDELSGAFGGHNHASMNAIYANDDSATSFNQIPGANANTRHYSQHSLVMRNRQQQQQQQQQASRSTNNLACADCQPATRRLSFKQFCHLDYAIKATILSRRMADDWTKFEVEIQDIFKSATSSSLLLHRNQRNFVVDSIQKASNFALDTNEVPVTRLSKSSPSINRTEETQEASEEQQQHQQQQSTLPLHHRSLKVGGVQSIWVPTEDVACKCPRLKTRSTYLLMGLVDTKENSVTSIQLDRHSVALEWKPNLQEKLIKYQRRHSRGRC